MKKNLSNGEMYFRVIVGILIIAAIYISSVSRWLLWILAAILIISGILKYCPIVSMIEKK